MKMKLRNFVLLITPAVAMLALFVGYGLFFKGEGDVPASSVGDASSSSVQDSSSLSAGEQENPAEFASTASESEPEDSTEANSNQSDKENDQTSSEVTPVQSNGSDSSVLDQFYGEDYDKGELSEETIQAYYQYKYNEAIEEYGYRVPITTDHIC